jgi:hypothetical protein
MRCAALLLLALVAALAAADPPRLTPPLQRLDLGPSDIRIATLTLSAAPGTAVTNIAVDCACLKSLTPLPAKVPANGRLDLTFRVTGMRPGMEEILVATGAGIARAQVQIVGAGAGRGRDQLRASLARAAAEGLELLAIAHDLRGQVRNCGCSQGSLGGAGRLARLPALARELTPTARTAWVLSGDADGHHAGLGAVLSTHGWRVGDPRVLVTADVLPALSRTDLVAVIPAVTVGAQHARIVEPVLSGGLAVELLLLDTQGRIVGRATMPVDAELPDDPSLAERFREPLTARLDHAANPSQNCAGCHQSAYQAWLGTRHAQALTSLAEADRTDACVGCHTTPIAAAVLAPAVSCQSCHAGSDAHAASGGQVQTLGATDCRSCHDHKHHPGFDRATAWPRIQHGREPVAPAATP